MLTHLQCHQICPFTLLTNNRSIRASPVTLQSVKPIFLIHPLGFSCIHSLIIHPWTLLSIYPSTAHPKLVFSKTYQSYLLVVCNNVQSYVLTCIVWRLCCLISFGFLVSISKIYHLNENQISRYPASSHSEDVKWCLFDKDTGSSHIHSKFLFLLVLQLYRYMATMRWIYSKLFTYNTYLQIPFHVFNHTK